MMMMILGRTSTGERTSADGGGYWCTCIYWSEAVYKEKLKHLALRETKLKLRTHTGEPVPVLGVMDVTVVHNEQKKSLPLVHHSRKLSGSARLPVVKKNQTELARSVCGYGWRHKPSTGDPKKAPQSC